MMMDNWRVERLQELPSPQYFASQVEPRNMPLVYEGSIKNWPAYSKWHPAEGGFSYLKSIASGETVQAMLSMSGNIFNGDIRSHERVELKFGDYLDYALQLYTELGIQGEESRLKDDGRLKRGCESHLLERPPLYLAQVPMFNKDQQISPLRALMQDIIMPSYLISNLVENVNLWMTACESKCSTHYDPYHNMLCVVVGQKQVTLWPPCATPFLYPYPVYGEASNHSSVNFVKPDDKMHPLSNHAMRSCQVVMLQAGDALFIPEGWYHQVDSHSFTIAVNLWWPSMVTLALNSHMSGYYLRRIVSSLLDCEKQKIIQMATSGQSRKEPTYDGGNEHQSSVKLNASELKFEQAEVTEHSSRLDEKQESMHFKRKGRKEAFELLTPLQKHCLQSLVLTCMPEDNVEAAVEQSGNVCLESVQNFEVSEKVEEVSVAPRPSVKSHKLMSSLQGENTVAQVFNILEPLALKQVLLVMVEHFPRTLEVLVRRKLSPIAAELLTRKFDEMDSVSPEMEQGEFYKAFYSVFEDSKVAMSALLDGKETFSALALNSVLEGYLGLSLPSSSA